MKNTDISRLKALNDLLDHSYKRTALLQEHHPEYLTLLREYVSTIMKKIVDATGDGERQILLKSIFSAQRNLMSMRTLGDTVLDDGLWEIADDFDNDDPRIYDYLLMKIKHAEYLIQRRIENT